MSEALYRKYRPQRFSDLIGQESIKTTLLNQIRGGKVAHAYLFTGPRGVGKTTTARLLAKAVNCSVIGKDGEPCGACDACVEITAGRSMDVVEMDAASHTGVDNVREQIIETVRFAPVKLPRKVFIIDEVHMLSTSAFNALLKTLEEPPSHVMFILATTELHKVPATIVSRCQKYDFRRLMPDVLVKRLVQICKDEGVKVEEEVLWAIARQAQGGGRDAETLLAQVLALGEKKVDMDTVSLVLPITTMQESLVFLSLLGVRDVKGSIEHIQRLVDAGVEMKLFLEDVVDWTRRLMLWKVASLPATLEAYPEDVVEKAKAASEKFSTADLAELLDLLHAAKVLPAAIPQLPLELVVVKFCKETPRAFSDARKEVTPDPAPASPSPESETVSNGALPEVEGIEKAWNDVVSDVAATHASLSLLLKNATVCGLEGDCLRLGYNFKFHADMINQPKSKQVVEDYLARRFGTRILLRGEYLHSQADAMVEDALSELGGKVVE